MNSRIVPRVTKNRGKFWAVLLFGPALLWTGCATPPEPTVSPEDIDSVTQRVEDVERINGRLTVRVEELERQATLMNDRVESNRLALQRRGYLRERNEEYARIPTGEENDSQRRPDPAPESSYRQQQRSGDYEADPTMQQRKDRRGLAEIPLSDQQSGHADRDRGQEYVEFDSESENDRDEAQEEIIITNEILEQRYGTGTSSRENERSASRSENSRRSSGSAHAPVTDERLPTTAELDESPSESSNSSDSSDSSSDQAPASERELLETYQDSLSLYRGGDYAEALQGFTLFLEAGPREDYIDNALYWIGECHFGLSDFETSVRYFQKILDEVPEGNKAPDAMLKMSLAYDELGSPGEAVELLEELTERYPRSNPGRLGQERLDEHPMAERD